MGAEPLHGIEADTAGGITQDSEGVVSNASNDEVTESDAGIDPGATGITDCPFCLGSVGDRAKKCRHCGEWVARPCTRCGTSLRGEWAARGICAECEAKGKSLVKRKSGLVVTEPKNKSVAALSAFFLGGLGTHRFYLGDPFSGLFYLLFCWTMIPTVIGVVEGIRFATMDDEEFHLRHSGEPLE